MGVHCFLWFVFIRAVAIVFITYFTRSKCTADKAIEQIIILTDIVILIVIVIVNGILIIIIVTHVVIVILVEIVILIVQVMRIDKTGLAAKNTIALLICGGQK